MHRSHLIQFADSFRKLGIKALIFLPVFLLIVTLGHELELHLPDLEHWVSGLGAWAPLGYIGAFILLTPLFASVDALCVAAGLLFSLKAGIIYMIVATFIAATIMFITGRYFFKEKIRRYLATHEKFTAVDKLVKQQAFKLMLLLRLTPLPFAMLSYAFAVAEVRFFPYLVTTSGILLYNITLVYIGYTTKHVAGIFSGSPNLTLLHTPLLVGGLMLALLILFLISAMAAKFLKSIQSDSDRPL